MFGLSFEELIVLLVLALILFGPEKLPEVSAKLGHWVAKLRQAGTEFARAVHSYQFPEPPGLSPSLHCPHCGHKLKPEFVFCPHCGAKIEPPKDINGSRFSG